MLFSKLQILQRMYGLLTLLLPNNLLVFDSSDIFLNGAKNHTDYKV